MPTLRLGSIGQQRVDVGAHDVVVDDEVGFVVLHHGQEGGHVEAAEVQ
jgi:hypothetical protein